MVVWYFDGTTYIGSAVPFPGVLPTQTGSSEGQLTSQATGELRIWALNGINAAWAENLNPAFVGPGWKIGAVGDANLDYSPDIVWRNELSGELVLWTMIGTNLARGTI